MSLFVEIMAEDVPIGTTNLSPSDPPMGVAFGIFHPSPAYAAVLHARATEEHEFTASPTCLYARTTQGAVLTCAGIDLVDFSATLGAEGREVHILGLENFELYFA